MMILMMKTKMTMKQKTAEPSNDDEQVTGEYVTLDMESEDTSDDSEKASEDDEKSDE